MKLKHITIASTPVEAKPRRLNCTFSVASAEDMRSDYGMAAEGRIIRVMGYAIKLTEEKWVKLIRPWHRAFILAASFGSFVSHLIDISLSGGFRGRYNHRRILSRYAHFMRPIRKWFIPAMPELTEEDWADIHSKIKPLQN